MRHILFIAFTPLTLCAAEADWPQFRGPTGQGLSTAKSVPVEWDATNNVAWKVEVPGRGWSSPVFAGGRLYLTSAQGDPGEEATLRALCFEVKDGKLIWNTEVLKAGSSSTSAMHRKNSLASPTPIVTADRLFVHFGHMGTAALDLTGKVIWRQESLKYSPVHGNGGSPVLAEGKLIFNCDAANDPFIAALDAANGEVKWKTPRKSPAKKQFSFSTPLVVSVDGSTQVVSPASGFVGAYEPKSGAEKWRVGYGEGYSVVPRPSFAHGLVFVSSAFDRPVVKAIRTNGASGDVTESHVAWQAAKGGPNTPSMIVVGDELYYVSDAGIVTCADARTGKVHWSERIPGNYSASPVAADGRLYFLNETGVCTVIRAGKTFENLAANNIGEATLASPAPADRTLFIRSEGHLWRIGK